MDERVTSKTLRGNRKWESAYYFRPQFHRQNTRYPIKGCLTSPLSYSLWGLTECLHG